MCLSALEQRQSPEVPLGADPVAVSPQLQQTQPGLRWCAGCPLDPFLFPKDAQWGGCFIEENVLWRRMLQRGGCSGGGCPGWHVFLALGGILTAPLPIVRAEELHSIKGELSQIKAQVDSLLESLDRMDQRRERLTGEGTGRRPSNTYVPVPGSSWAHVSLSPELGVRGTFPCAQDIQSWLGRLPTSIPFSGLVVKSPAFWLGSWRGQGKLARAELALAQVPQISSVSAFSGSKESEKKRAEPGTESPSPVGEGSRESRGKEGTGADGHSDLRNIDSAEESTDTEEMVRGGPDPMPSSLLP